MSVWLLKKNFAPLARRLSSVLVGSSSTLALMINRFLARAGDSEKMVTTPSEPTCMQLQSLLDTGKCKAVSVKQQHSYEFCLEDGSDLSSTRRFYLNSKQVIQECLQKAASHFCAAITSPTEGDGRLCFRPRCK